MSNGSTTWTYTYNADGLRTKRTNGSTVYGYVYNGSLLTQMTVGSNTLYITYDTNGAPFTLTYNGTVYYYVLNLQGDVVGIVDSAGTLVVEYAYDAWGRIHRTTGSMAATLGAHNPLRYRGYVYDTETGLYYLQSRYYNPEIGRFINADGLVSTGQGPLGNNMFAYCGNNPVNFYDPHGTQCICMTQRVHPRHVCNSSKIKNDTQATVALNIGGGLSIGPFGFAFQLSLVSDLNNNVELQFSYAVPISTATPSVDDMLAGVGGLGFSALCGMTITNAPGPEYLHGLGHQTGVSLGNVAVDINTIPAPSKDTTYSGVTLSGGLATPDFHHTMSNTICVAKPKINFWDLIDAAYRGVWGIQW